MTLGSEKTGVLLRALSQGDDLASAAAKAGCSVAEAQGALWSLGEKIGPLPEPVREKQPAGTIEAAIAYIDGGARGNPGPAGCGIYLLDSSGQVLAENGRYLGEMTNNEAEYHGLIAALEKAIELGVEKVEVRSDSQLVVRQMQGSYKVKAKNLIPLFIRANKLLRDLGSIRFVHIPREENKEADRLANEAMDRGLGE